MPDPELCVRDVSISFGRKLAADRVSFDVRKGEFIAVLGPSGSGKSTLLRMLGGQIEPDSGEIKLGGQSIVGLSPNQIDCATVFQDYALFPHMSVIQNVEFGLVMRKWGREERRARAMEALAMVDMEQMADRGIEMLSGGEKQRVATARALAVRPRVLLMDEPLSALDRLIRLRVQREISTLLHGLEVTTIYVTHDQREALTMADRVVVMQQGRLEQVAPPLELIRAPRSRFVAEFLGGAGNYVEAEVVAPSDRDGLVEVDSPLGRLAVRSPESGYPAGTGVTVHVRPEDIVLDETATDFEVRSAAFTGEVAEILVDDGRGRTLTVKRLGICDLDQGRRIGLTVAPGAAVIIPNEESE